MIKYFKKALKLEFIVNILAENSQRRLLMAGLLRKIFYNAMVLS